MEPHVGAGIFLVFLGVGFAAFLPYLIVGACVRGHRRRSWIQGTAIVTSASWESRSGGGPGPGDGLSGSSRRTVTRVDYVYSAGGARSPLSGTGRLPRWGAKQGDQVKVLIDPRNPSKSILDEQGWSPIGCMLPFGLVFFAVGIGLIWFGAITLRG